MVLELLSIRISAPYFGMSNYVTGIILNTIIGALALGYWIGGWLADRTASLKKLYFIFLIGGLYLLAVLFGYKWFFENMSTNFSALTITLSCLLIFFVPMTVLAMVTPIAGKMLTISNMSGKAYGITYAVSTLGSMAGGLLTTFFLLSHFGSRAVLEGCVVLVLGIGVIGLITLNKKYGWLLLFGLLVFFVPLETMKHNIIYQVESAFNLIWVEKDNNDLFLRFNNGFGYHSKTIDDKTGFCNCQYDNFLFAPLVTKVDKLLILGNGGGTMLNMMNNFFVTEIDTVEIDPVVIEVAKKYFEVPDADNIHVYNHDARVYINENKKKYDAIFVDLFDGNGLIPFYLVTDEFYRKVNQGLSDDGVVVINYNPKINNDKTTKVFENVLEHNFVSCLYADNTFFCWKKKMNKKDIENKLNSSSQTMLVQRLSKLYADLEEVKVTDGVLFTDDLVSAENIY